jgi:hypothetical protein
MSLQEINGESSGTAGYSLKNFSVLTIKDMNDSG